MKKEKLTIEYPLENASESLLWRMVGKPLGLALWFADGVTVNGNEYTFNWDDHEQTAFLIEQKEGVYTRFQWEEDKDTDAFFQIEIVTQDLSGHIGLLITDYVKPTEKEDLILIWDSQIDNLKRKSGI
ncbi:MAG TPA: SRPBCC domain-containing protein [Bacteroidales bacterium]|nr:SRPBCC domain-containing protein [Bacteroidales bacterium]